MSLQEEQWRSVSELRLCVFDLHLEPNALGAQIDFSSVQLGQNLSFRWGIEIKISACETKTVRTSIFRFFFFVSGWRIFSHRTKTEPV